MKKILLALFVFTLTACSTPQASEEVVSEDKRELISNSKIQECIKSSFKIQREECYLKYVKDKVYSDDIKNITSGDVSVCDYIEEGTQNNAECNWLFAMKLREEDLCDKISYEPVIEDDYLSKEICHQSLSYEYGDTKWTLEQGIPPYADPENLEYFGDAKIRGWIVMEPIYVGEAVEQFKVYSEDIIKLPPSFRHRSVFQLKNYSLKDGYRPVDDNLMEDLRSYSESNPATISVQSVYALQEGSPFMGIKEIITE